MRYGALQMRRWHVYVQATLGGGGGGGGSQVRWSGYSWAEMLEDVEKRTCQAHKITKAQA